MASVFRFWSSTLVLPTFLRLGFPSTFFIVCGKSPNGPLPGGRPMTGAKMRDQSIVSATLSQTNSARRIQLAARFTF